jgi:predicted NBD/HSP70 family sugar kinase
LKKLNERKRGLKEIIDTIKISGPMTQTDLKEESNLLGSTASYLVNVLKNMGLLIDGGEIIQKNGPGKPAAILKLNNDLANFIGIYLEDYYLHLYVTGLDGAILESKAVPISNFRDLEKVMIISIKEIVLSNSKIKGIGIAVKGIVYNDGNIEFGYRESIKENNWHLQGLLERLESIFADIPIIMENDANCTAVLFQFKQGKNNMNLILYLLNISPFGIGCSILIDGRLYRGYSGSAGRYFEKNSNFSKIEDLNNRNKKEIESFIDDMMSHVRMSSFLLDPEEVILSGSIFDNINNVRREQLQKLLDDYQLPFKIRVTKGNNEFNPAAGAALISTNNYISGIIDKVGVR